MVTNIEPKGIFEKGRIAGHVKLAFLFKDAGGKEYAAWFLTRDIYLEGLTKTVGRMLPVRVLKPADPGNGEFEVTTA